jgi:hypothetical protein
MDIDKTAMVVTLPHADAKALDARQYSRSRASITGLRRPLKNSLFALSLARLRQEPARAYIARIT